MSPQPGAVKDKSSLIVYEDAIKKTAGKIGNILSLSSATQSWSISEQSTRKRIIFLGFSLKNPMTVY